MPHPGPLRRIDRIAHGGAEEIHGARVQLRGVDAHHGSLRPAQRFPQSRSGEEV
nr:hypothetical protein [Corynebacterium oculi]